MGEIEMTYNPDVVFPPGDTLDEVLAEREMTQRELAERTGLHKKTINEIVRGKAPISPGVALKLETVLGISARFWLTLEQQYQEFVARQRGREELAREVDWLDRLPVAEMVSRGLVKASQDRVQQLQHVLTFFGIATPKQRLAVFPSFRRSQAFVHDDEATLVWLQAGRQIAEQMACEPFNGSGLRALLPRLRQLTARPFQKAWAEVRRLCATVGVALVIVPEFSRTHVCGATVWLSHERVMVLMSLRYRRADRFWFSFFHELGHVLLHGKDGIFVDGEGSTGTAEEEADAFANDVLIPKDRLTAFLRSRPMGHIRHKDVNEFAAREGINRGIIVGRLQHVGSIARSYMNELRESLPGADEALEEQRAALQVQRAATRSPWAAYLAVRDEIAALPTPAVSALADLEASRR